MKTILLIDDDPFALRILDRQLERLGCVGNISCLQAGDAARLLETQSETVGLIFCDLQMPDMDGVEFVRYLASIGYRGDLAMVSGEDERILQTVKKLAEAHQIPMLGALAKPVATERLKQVLAASNAVRASPKQRPHIGTPYSPDEIKHAIEAGELVNHYQPKVSLSTGELLGVEALVRWQHPQAGLVFPDAFISIAEEHGHIDRLTEVVLSGALRQLREWQTAGLDIQVAVNLSMDNLAVLDFPERVVQMANDAGVALSSIVLEVTESRLMRDLRAQLDILTRLRLKRISLSIDDFGTGHSSLVQLRDIPFDELKLDRSFVSGAVDDAALRAIVDSTLRMTRQLGIKSVAEGVETRADWIFLRDLGCDVSQGYFISKPMPGRDLLSWRADWEHSRRALVMEAS